MEEKENSIGCCGHDCARCITYLATVRSDDRLREQAQAFYRDTFHTDLPLDAFHCLGCRSDKVFVLCRECPFTACADRRGISHCKDCAEHPCPALAAYTEKYVNRCNQIPPDEVIS